MRYSSTVNQQIITFFRLEEQGHWHLHQNNGEHGERCAQWWDSWERGATREELLQGPHAADPNQPKVHRPDLHRPDQEDKRADLHSWVSLSIYSIFAIYRLRLLGLALLKELVLTPIVKRASRFMRHKKSIALGGKAQQQGGQYPSEQVFCILNEKLIFQTLTEAVPLN